LFAGIGSEPAVRRNKMRKEDIAHILKETMLFQRLERSQLLATAAVARISSFPEGSYVYRQDDLGEGFYIVASGEVDLVLSRDDGEKIVVGRVGPGGHFGETPLITGKPHSVGARAKGKLVLIWFDRHVFHEVLLGDDSIHSRMNLALAERLRVSFRDQADSAIHGHRHVSGKAASRSEDFSYFPEDRDPGAGENGPNTQPVSTTAKRVQTITSFFAKNLHPVFLSGESGTGKKLLANQIHLQGVYAQGPYIEVDLKGMEEEEMVVKLFGNQRDDIPFTQARQVGTFEQFSGGTVALPHCESMSPLLQQKLIQAVTEGSFTRVGGNRKTLFQCRVIFISELSLEDLDATGRILPKMLEILQRQHYRVPPLRELRRDLPRLIEHFLRRYGREYDKNIHKISPNSMGILLNYEWPGNLPELASVIQRAVMLAQKDEILTDQILLGLPKTEGKWEFNVLRIPWVKKLLESKFFPVIPRAIIGYVFLIAVLALFFGPTEPEKNIGMTLSWVIGWPVLFFSFFFLGRLWCTVCTLTVPGRMVQSVLKPDRSAPKLVKKYSGWIMALLCILVLWVEIVWDAHNNPRIGGWVILSVMLGALFFRTFFKRRAWCLYVCPLGAINAIFAMPSILELRANRHLCLNRCREHVCFGAENERAGCPMYRHPFLVDNNRDCILCAKCIKSCKDNSIHLNFRLAPQELWDLETPRRPDSFLIVALGAIFFPFALQERFLKLIGKGLAMLPFGIHPPQWLAATAVFFGLILLFEIGYGLMVAIQARYAAVNKEVLLPLLGYGFIPLILGCYLTVHFNIFIGGAWRIWPNFLSLVGLESQYQAQRILSTGGTAVLQTITILGGMLASFYAIFRIMARLKGSRKFSSRMLLLPYSFMIILGGLSLFII
jgi:CRP-like cAMP-binding protein